MVNKQGKRRKSSNNYSTQYGMNGTSMLYIYFCVYTILYIIIIMEHQQWKRKMATEENHRTTTQLKMACTEQVRFIYIFIFTLFIYNYHYGASTMEKTNGN